MSRQRIRPRRDAELAAELQAERAGPPAAEVRPSPPPRAYLDEFAPPPPLATDTRPGRGETCGLCWQPIATWQRCATLTATGEPAHLFCVAAL